LSSDLERLLEPLEVLAEVGRQLPKDGAELAGLVQGLERFEETGRVLVEVDEALDVGRVATALDRELEVVRGLLGPAFDGRLAGQAVEGVVDLDRPKDGRVVLEPAALWQLLGVERAAPVLVDPA